MNDFTPALLPPHHDLCPDPEAAALAADIHELFSPPLTLFMGSRARGDHNPSSDLDLLMAWPDRPSPKDADLMTERATEAAHGRHSQDPPVNLFHVTLQAFEEDRLYANSFLAGPLLQGILFTSDPNRYDSPYRDPLTPILFDWRPYSQSLKTAPTNLQDARIIFGDPAYNSESYYLSATVHAILSAEHGTDAALLAAAARREPLATGEARLAHLHKALPETAYQAAARALDATDAMRQETSEVREALFPEADEALEELRQCAKDLRKLTGAAIRKENRRRANAGR